MEPGPVLEAFCKIGTEACLKSNAVSCQQDCGYHAGHPILASCMWPGRLRSTQTSQSSINFTTEKFFFLMQVLRVSSFASQHGDLGWPFFGHQWQVQSPWKLRHGGHDGRHAGAMVSGRSDISWQHSMTAKPELMAKATPKFLPCLNCMGTRAARWSFGDPGAWLALPLHVIRGRRLARSPACDANTSLLSLCSFSTTLASCSPSSKPLT